MTPKKKKTIKSISSNWLYLEKNEKLIWISFDLIFSSTSLHLLQFHLETIFFPFFFLFFKNLIFKIHLKHPKKFKILFFDLSIEFQFQLFQFFFFQIIILLFSLIFVFFFLKHYATDSSVFDDFLALPCIRNIIILDNSGARIIAKYYSSEKDPKAFEKELWTKTRNRNATDTDLIVLEGESSGLVTVKNTKFI